MSLDYHRVDASIGYGITDRWEISASVPYEKYVYSRSQLGVGGPDINRDGLGNAHIGTKFRIFGAQGDASTLALNLFVEPSSGDDKVASKDTGFGGGLGWRLNKWVIDLGYFDPGGDFAKDAHAGIGYVGRVSDNFDWITEAVANFYSSGKNVVTLNSAGVVDGGSFHKYKDRYDLTTGGRVWLGGGDWAFNFALRTDLAQLSSISDHCPLGGLLGFTYFPRLVRHEPPPPPPPPPAPEPPPPPPPAPEPPPAPAPPPPPPPPPPAPAPPERMEVTCDFTPGSARLDNRCKAKLDEVGLRMKDKTDSNAQVTGFDAAQRLADQRAQAVKNYLVTRHGIGPSRITTQGQTGSDRKATVVLTIPSS